MDPVACIDLPALPLQLLLRRRAEWRGRPAAVVDRDKPQGVLLWVNERARAQRALPGMRYAAALALARDLRAGVVPAEEIRAAVERLTRLLWRFTPHVEPSRDEPGTFWLDASGMQRLHRSRRAWAAAVHGALRADGLRAVVAVGFTRFGSYAAARTGRGVLVFDTRAAERAHLRRAPLERLRSAPRLRALLERLGVRTLGAFADLPEAGVRRRFGAEAAELHAWARGACGAPLQPQPHRAPPARRHLYDLPETDRLRLLAHLGRALRELAELFARRDEEVTALRLRLREEDGGAHDEHLRPAAPTADAGELQALLRLRLEALDLRAGVTEWRLQASGTAAFRRQALLFQGARGRDPEAVQRALARLRAELGDDAVVRARLHDGHLPEARFAWEPLARLEPARPRTPATRPLVRRFHAAPAPLAARPDDGRDPWFPGDLEDGPAREVIGPHVVSGGWWAGDVARAYHYARTGSGRWLWVFHDRARRRWFLHGEIG